MILPSLGSPPRASSQRQLVELARQLLPDSTALHEQLDELLASQASLGMLTDVFAFTLGFSPAIKQRLLAEWNVDRRSAPTLRQADGLSRAIDGGRSRPAGNRLSAAV